MLFENLTRSAAGAKVIVMEVIEHIRDIYSLPGFRAAARVKQHPFDPYGLVVTLKRRQKKRFAGVAAMPSTGSGTAESILCGTWTAVQGTSILNLNIGGFIAANVRP
jgi:hypothetical protein